MKKILMVTMMLLLLSACGKSVDVKEMYEVNKSDEAAQSTMNIDVSTTEKYDEADLKKIIIDASSQYDHNKVNGIRFNIVDGEGKGYADAKIAFNETGMKATGVKKKNIAEINMK